MFFDVSPAHSTHLSCSIEKETRLGAILGAEDGVLKGMETSTLAFTVKIVTRNGTKNRENNHFIKASGGFTQSGPLYTDSPNIDCNPERLGSLVVRLNYAA